MKKIAVVSPDFYPTNGGYANAIRTMVTWLAGTGSYEIHVFTRIQLNGNPELEIANLDVHRVPQAPKPVRTIKGVNGIVRMLSRNRQVNCEAAFLRAVFAEHRFDFVLVETFESADFSVKAVLYSGLPASRCAVRIHGCTETELFVHDTSVPFQRMFRDAKVLSSRVLNILSTTPFYIPFYKRHYCHDDINLEDKNYAVLPNFALLDPSPLDANDAAVLDTIFDDDRFPFLTLGRMYYQGYQQKNFEQIAFAMRLLRTRKNELFRRLRIVHVGSGDMRPAFEAMLDDLSIREAFILLERCSNRLIQEMQRRVSAAILVSKYEGHAMFAAEALANSCPLIVSRNTGVSHLVEDSLNGFLVDSDSPFELALAMERCVMSSKEVMRNHARRVYEERYHPKAITEVFDALIDYLPHSRKRLPLTKPTG